MTFSIAARSADGTAFGVAVASKFLAVGAAVPAARVQTGAVATQALANLAYREDVLQLLAGGADAQAAVDQVTGADVEREHRQLGVVGGAGDGASWTGADCLPWAGGAVGEGYAIQGNILTGPEVVAAMERAWLDPDPGIGFVDRLLAALSAGDRTGGDRRGRQSAALLVVTPQGGYGGESDVLADLRVDDHPDPVPELVRLRTLHALYFERPDPAACLPLDAGLAGEVAGLLAAAGHSPADPSTAALEAALASWAGMENLEERLVPGRLDPVVLDHLRTTQGVRP